MLKFAISDKFKGIGASQGLDRGLLVYDGNELIVGEGLGIGACALQSGGFTYFSTITSIDDSQTEDSFQIISNIDIKLVWKLFGIRSQVFTRIIESICDNIYKKHEKRQNMLLKLEEFLTRIFRIKLCFDKIPSLGTIKIDFKINYDEISSDTAVSEVSADLTCEAEMSGFRLYVMNEIDGAMFSNGLKNGEITSPPSGWQKIDSQCELYSEEKSLAFSLTEISLPENITSRIYWGREVISSCNWAGFESEIITGGTSVENYKYKIRFREVNL
ncbi:MAG: hypothetical protein ACYCYI_02335 [Saccharofermentanales bacterium]